jgi:hypothetical protein
VVAGGILGGAATLGGGMGQLQLQLQLNLQAQMTLMQTMQRQQLSLLGVRAYRV